MTYLYRPRLSGHPVANQLHRGGTREGGEQIRIVIDGCIASEHGICVRNGEEVPVERLRLLRSETAVTAEDEHPMFVQERPQARNSGGGELIGGREVDPAHLCSNAGAERVDGEPENYI